MVKVLRSFSIWLTLALLLTSCSTAQEKTNEKQVSADVPESNSPTDIVVVLNRHQKSAFDALNTLQTNTDERNRLYSTFANTNQPCYPADTSFRISQTELLAFMEKFVSKHCQRLTPMFRNELAESSVLAQEEYTVLYCSDSLSDTNYKNGMPMSGTWVIPGILGRRDVLLVW